MRHLFRISITPFLWSSATLLVLVFIAVGLNALSSIKEVGERASEVREVNLPEIIESQRSFINVEGLRRLAEVVYVSDNPRSRRIARIEAQAQAAESVFGKDASFHEQALQLSKKITELAGRRDAAHQNGVRLEEIAREYGRSIFYMSAYIPNIDVVKSVIDAFFSTSIPLASPSAVSPEGLKAMGERQKTDAEHMAFINKACREYSLFYASLGAFCDQQEALYEDYRLTQDLLAENYASASAQWQAVDAAIKEMRDNVSSGSEFVTTDALTSIEATSEKAFSTSTYMFAGGACFFILYLTVLHWFIVKPLRWTGKKLQDLQHGVLHDDVPCSIRIVELYRMADLLDRFSGHLAELTSQASQLAEDAEAKKDLEKLMTAVFKVSVNGYAIWDPQDVYVINDELLNLLGYADIEEAKRNWSDIGFLEQAKLGELYDEVLRTGQVRREAYLKNSAGEHFPVETTYLPIKRQGKIRVLSYFRDLREQKHTEEILRQAKNDAEEAARAKSEFLARMSHEIRTPMNGVLGLTHLALAGSPPPEQRQYLEKIQASARILLGVINDILDFSKMESGRFTLEFRSFSFVHMLITVTDLFNAQAASKGLAFTVETDERLPLFVKGDELRLSQVLLNLCGNAIKFTERGGVTLAITLAQDGDGEVLVRFSVKDTGVGMTAGQLARLFQPFTQADTSTTRKYGGTGLGLVISKHLVEMMRGTLEVRSEAGSGSEFFFTIPLERACEPVEESTAADDDRLYGSLAGKRVLLAEDNEINQEIAVALLNSLDITALVAGNGREALDILRQTPVDGILMDIQMPVMDGLTAARAVRESEDERVRGLPIIAMTAHAMQEDREKSLAAGMNDHINKPIDVQELKEKLVRWLPR